MAEGQTKSDCGNILEVHCVETVTGDWLIYYGTASHHSIELDADSRCFPTGAEMSDFLANWRKAGQFTPLPGSLLSADFSNAVGASGLRIWEKRCAATASP